MVGEFRRTALIEPLQQNRGLLQETVPGLGKPARAQPRPARSPALLEKWMHGRQNTAAWGRIFYVMGTSITTGRGDTGQTDLLLGGRAGKAHPRLHAVGEVDELNAALGLARVHLRTAPLQEMLRRAQTELVAVMGILSAGPENAERYAAQGFQDLSAEAVARLTAEAASLEAGFPGGFKGWSIPGDAGGAGAAWLEMARTICRRAERAVAALPASDAPLNAHLLPWLNRFSDLLWLAARTEEKTHSVPG